MQFRCHVVLQFAEISGGEVVSFLAQNVSFGMLVASTLAPRGTIERSRETSEHKKRDLGVHVWISVDLDGFRDRILRVFGRLWKNKCFLLCMFTGRAF